MTINELEKELEGLYKKIDELRAEFEDTPEFQVFEYDLLEMKLKSLLAKVSDTLCETRRIDSWNE